MITKYILPVIAIAGVLFAVLFVHAGNKPLPTTQPVALPAQPPFESYIAGAGIIEASTENIAIGTLVAGVVSDVYVKVGDDIKVGQPLFKIDDRELKADLDVKAAAIISGSAKAKVDEASLNDVTSQLQMYQVISDVRAISKDELDRRKFAVEIQQAKLDQSRADVAAAKAQMDGTKTLIDRLTVRSPIDGQALQVKIRVGEYALAGLMDTPLMLVGNVKILNVRTDIDENDAWRLKKTASARAYLRGNKDIFTELKFARVEPYVVPKRSLTGDSSERVDTRVLQVLYSFDASTIPVYVGQQMDVFIEAPPVTPALASSSERLPTSPDKAADGSSDKSSDKSMNEKVSQ